MKTVFTNIYVIAVSIMILPVSCLSQNVKSSRFIPKDATSSGMSYTVGKLPEENFDSFYDLTQDLPKDYVKDGSVDYTSFLQQGISRNKKVKFPNFPMLINDAGLTLQSSSQLFFPDESILILSPSNKERYEILRLHNVSDVAIYNPKIRGDRSDHKGTTGEWGMGISIRASNDIAIFNPDISNCWGDGIYLGHLRNVQNNRIKIYHALINNNRRNGISITSGNDVLVEHPYILNTHGVAPASGIVIEPSNDMAEFNGIVINNAITYNNLNSGIRIGGLEKLIGKAKLPVNIELDSHTDIGSKDAVFIGRILSPERLPGPALSGEIKIINPNWEDNTNSDFTKRSHYGRGPTIVFSKLNSKLRGGLLKSLGNDKDVKFEN